MKFVYISFYIYMKSTKTGVSEHSKSIRRDRTQTFFAERTRTGDLGNSSFADFPRPHWVACLTRQSCLLVLSYPTQPQWLSTVYHHWWLPIPGCDLVEDVSGTRFDFPSPGCSAVNVLTREGTRQPFQVISWGYREREREEKLFILWRLWFKLLAITKISVKTVALSA